MDNSPFKDIMDDSRYNEYGTHCLNDLILQMATPMGDAERNETLYILRKTHGSDEPEYLTEVAKWRGDPYTLMVVFIDRRDAEAAVQKSYPGFEIEEISGADLNKKLLGKLGINFKYVADGKRDEINVPPVYFEKYDEYQRQGRPKVSTSEFLASLPRIPDFLPQKKMKIIRDTFEGLGIEGAVVTVATVNLMGASELVVDFDREGGFKREEISRIELANRRLQMRFGHPAPFYVNAEIDHNEPAPELKAARNKPQRDPAEVERIRAQRQQRKQKGRNGAKTQPDDGFVCAQITNKLKKKQRTMEHPLVQHLAEAFESRKYQPIAPDVLDDEAYDIFMHLDLDGDYIIGKDGVDIYLDEPIWKRSFDPKIHNEDHGQKTIRQLLEFVEENQTPVRLFFPDREGLDFITIPFAQLHEYHSLMPREIPSRVEELRTLPRVETPEAQTLSEQATNHFRGVPGTAAHAYVAQDDGRTVLVVEVEELKPLTDITDTQLFGRSVSFQDTLPEGMAYRFKVVPPFQRDSGSQSLPPAGR